MALMEELGSGLVQDELEFKELEVVYKDEHNTFNTLQQATIPNAQDKYDSDLAMNEEDHAALKTAHEILMKHFGVTDNNNRLEQEAAAAPNTDGAVVTNDARAIGQQRATRSG